MPARTLARVAGGLYLTVAVYLLLRHVSQPVAAAMVTFVAVSVAILCLDLFARFLAPGVAERISSVVLAPALVGEVAFVAWLLVKGVRVSEPAARVPAAA
jgi:hypothetical protein